MAKFNTPTKGVNRTTTYEGAPAIKTPDLKEDLVRKVLTTFFNEPKFYGNVKEQTADLIASIRRMAEVDPKFLRNLAIYARNEFHLRSVTHVIIAELAATVQGKPYVRKLVKEIVVRPDDMTEIMSYYLNTHGKPIPNSLKKGLADVFGKFDEYQLQKYNRAQDVRLKDILCIAHPTPQNFEQSDMWKRLLENNLQTPYTWEVELSTKGNNQETWKELIESGRVGYMALLRNLRNILTVEPDNIQKVISTISNKNKVLKSRQLPFRFYSAYKEVEKILSFNTQGMLKAIENALEYSVENIETIPGNTFISMDDSLSMTWCSPSRKSQVSCADIAAVLTAIANRICDRSITSAFSSSFRPITINPNNGIIANAKTLINQFEGGGTYMHLAFKWLTEKRVAADRIIIVSDDQAHPAFSGDLYHRFIRGTEGSARDYFEKYKKEVNPDVWLHLIDTAGYGRQQFLGEKVNYIGGWSEKVLTFIPLVEQGIGTMVQRIEQIE